MAGEDVVPTVDMFAVDGEAAPRDDSEDPLDDDEAGDMIQSRPTLVAHVWLGEDGDGHGEGSVVVEDGQHQPDPPQYDQPVAVTQDHTDRHHQVGHEDQLTHVQPVLVVGDVVQHHVREGAGVGWDPVVGHRQAQRGGQEAAQQEESTEQGLERLRRDSLVLNIDINQRMFTRSWDCVSLRSVE